MLGPSSLEGDTVFHIQSGAYCTPVADENFQGCQTQSASRRSDKTVIVNSESMLIWGWKRHADQKNWGRGNGLVPGITNG